MGGEVRKISDAMRKKAERIEKTVENLNPDGVAALVQQQKADRLKQAADYADGNNNELA